MRCVGGDYDFVVVLGEIDGFPFAVDDVLADLRGGLALLGFVVGEDGFFFAEQAAGGVGIDETIEQTFVADFAIAVAETGLLVEDSFFFRGERVDILSFEIGELFRVLCGGKARFWG